MNGFSVHKHIDLYSSWVDAQKPIRSMLSVDDGCVRIQDKVEITEKEVKLKGKDSIDTLISFSKALRESICLINKGMPELEDLIRKVEKGEATTHDLDALKHRAKHMEKIRECCKSLESFLEPITNGDFTPLLDPQFLKLLQELDACFGGRDSPPVAVTLKLTYDV